MLRNKWVLEYSYPAQQTSGDSGPNAKRSTETSRNLNTSI